VWTVADIERMQRELHETRGQLTCVVDEAVQLKVEVRVGVDGARRATGGGACATQDFPQPSWCTQADDKRRQVAALRTAVGGLAEASASALAEAQLGMLEVREALRDLPAYAHVEHILQRIGGATVTFLATQDELEHTLASQGVVMRLARPAKPVEGNLGQRRGLRAFFVLTGWYGVCVWCMQGCGAWMRCRGTV
jgi:hypothetical protein